MTKKDYELIARAIRNIADARGAHETTVRAIVQSLSASLASDNPRFNSLTFKTACTGTIDLSGRDYRAKLDEERIARRNREQDIADRVA